MNRAEDLANEIYKGDTPITKLRRKDYCNGYHQAEKDIMEKVCYFLNGYAFIPTYVINDLKQAIKDEQG